MTDDRLLFWALQYKKSYIYYKIWGDLNEFSTMGGPKKVCGGGGGGGRGT